MILLTPRSAALLIATALLAAACGGPSVSPTTLASPTATPTASPTNATSESVAPTTPAGTTAVCETSKLRIWLIKSSAGLGAVGGYLAFLNTGSQPCDLQGWPTIVGEPETGQSPRNRHVAMTLDFPPVSGVSTVRLRSGDAAVAAFSAGDNPASPSSPCPPPYRTLIVTPPQNTNSVTLSAWIPYANADMPSCTAIEVTMVVSASVAGVQVPGGGPSSSLPEHSATSSP